MWFVDLVMNNQGKICKHAGSGSFDGVALI